MSLELKIKSKHLAVESKIIRHEELKLKKQAKWQRERQGHEADYDTQFLLNKLANHRRYDVRNEARATLLARSYLAGKEYSQVELSRKEEKEMDFEVVVFPRILAMINKYGNNKVTKEQLQEWLKL